MSDQRITVIAHLRPKDGAIEKLRTLRPQLVEDFRTHYRGLVSATLYAVDGTDEWRDVVVFADRASLDAAGEVPTYAEWSPLVDLLATEILETVDIA